MTMKKTLLLLAMLGASMSALAQGVSQYDLNQPIGWASVGGETTGSSDEEPVTVTTMSQFVNALKGTAKKTIYVKGEIVFSSRQTVSNGQNKTVYGLPGSALVNLTHSDNKSESGILRLSNCKNIIIRNLTFKGAGAYDMDFYDDLTIDDGSSYIWIDHCDFQDGVDGNLDCNNGSDNISVTWCRFRYLIAPWAGGTGGSDDHRYSNLWGGDDKSSKDLNHLRTTFANCWWDEGCVERMPRVRFGEVHIVNCLYSSSVVGNYCIGAGYRANLYVENCAFTTSRAKSRYWKKYATKSGYTDFNITITNCLGVSDVQQKSGSIDYFIPSNVYSLTAFDKNEVEAEVSAYAGATLSIEENQKYTTGLPSVVNERTLNESLPRYNLSGQRVDNNYKGIVIQGGKKYLVK